MHENVNKKCKEGEGAAVSMGCKKIKQKQETGPKDMQGHVGLRDLIRAT